MPYADATLSDVYTQQTGEVFMTGIQALVRLPLMQIAPRPRGRAQYRAASSPAIAARRSAATTCSWRAPRRYLDAADIRVPARPQRGARRHRGLGHAAAAAVSRRDEVDGVFGIWYGKGPGVDRSGDVFKHANAAGTSPTWRRALPRRRRPRRQILDHAAPERPRLHVGDDPGALPLQRAGILEFGLLGIAHVALFRLLGGDEGDRRHGRESSVDGRSRDGAATSSCPTDFAMPPDGLNLRWPDDRWTQDYRLQNYKGYAAIAFARANDVDRIVHRSAARAFGIVASGKAYDDLRQALAELGIDEAQAAALGLRLYKVGMPWPLEPVRRAATSPKGSQKSWSSRSGARFVENQIKQQLFNWPPTAGRASSASSTRTTGRAAAGARNRRPDRRAMCSPARLGGSRCRPSCGS